MSPILQGKLVPMFKSHQQLKDLPHDQDTLDGTQAPPRSAPFVSTIDFEQVLNGMAHPQWLVHNIQHHLLLTFVQVCGLVALL